MQFVSPAPDGSGKRKNHEHQIPGFPTHALKPELVMSVNPNNHPNRSWRVRMRQTCAAWMGEWLWPVDGSIGVMDLERLQDLMQKSYRAGYESGRASMQRGKLAATDAPTPAREN